MIAGVGLRRASIMEFTKEQVSVIEAIIDTFYAPVDIKTAHEIISESNNSKNDMMRFLTFAAQDLNPVDDFITMIKATPKDKQALLSIVLKLLSTTAGTFLLMGGRSMKPFASQSRKEREQGMLRLANTKISQLRLLFNSFFGLSVSICYGKMLDSPSGKTNPVWKAISYPGPIPERPRPPPETFWRPKFVDLSSEIRVPLKDGQYRVNLECDVVVVGSGAGGGVVAAELAKSGLNVIVVDKSVYTHPSDYSLGELDSIQSFFEQKGTLQTEEGSMRILAGSVWGGGTTINWSASLETPQQVRQEWAKKYGLAYFTTSAFQNSIEAVRERNGISDKAIKHNPSNEILLNGCKKLGYHAAAIPQNTAGKEHSCGWCTWGCPYAEKQGSYATWLKDASEFGSRFVQGAYVERVIYEKGVAKGVWAKTDNECLYIAARKFVVVSCGSIHTPALLLRSGLRNRNIGKNLRLHPVTTVSGYFPDRRITPYSGAIMTVVSDQVANRGDGYGARLEVPTCHPSVFATLVPWNSAADHKRLMTQVDNWATFISLTRDKDSQASVWIDKEGRPRVNFNLSPYDAESMLQGLETGIKVMIAEGAKGNFPY